MSDSEDQRPTVRQRASFVTRDTASVVEPPKPVPPIELDALAAPLRALDAAADRYHVIERIGMGGMGEVSGTLDAKIGREIALKTMLRQDPQQMPVAQARFLREARVQALLEHPAVVPVYDMGLSPDGLPYFTMKRVRGQTLHDVINELADGKRATVRRTGRHRLLSAFLTVCWAVDYAHQRGVVHRDLKPENIMLGAHGEVYILDWGLAKLMPNTAPSSALDRFGDSGTRPGEMVGTPGFMPPEQVLGQHEEVDGRADVYALGAVLFEILTLRPLIEGHDLIALVEQTMNPTRSVGPAPPDVAPELFALVVEATRFHKDQRIGSARALAERIERYLDGDRDQEQREKLAKERAKAALEELEKTRTAAEPSERALARSRAMNAAGRALALSPGNGEAASVVLELLARPPSSMPKEVEVEIEELSAARRKRGMRDNALRICSWFLLVPVGLAMGVARPAWVLAMVTLMVVLALSAVWAWRRSRFERSVRWSLLGLTTAFFTLVSGLFGPFILVPALCAMNALLYAMLSPRSERPGIVAVGLVPFVVPTLLELGGVVPASFLFTSEGITLLPRFVEFPATLTFVFLSSVSAFSIILPTFVTGGLKDALDEAEKRILLQKWQFSQLNPAVRSK